jgi:hypothetical protein
VSHALITTSQSGKYDHDSASRVWNVASRTVIHTFCDRYSYGAGRLVMVSELAMNAVEHLSASRGNLGAVLRGLRRLEDAGAENRAALEARARLWVPSTLPR